MPNNSAEEIMTRFNEFIRLNHLYILMNLQRKYNTPIPIYINMIFRITQKNNCFTKKQLFN